jgi:hypothetical protein
LSAGRKTWLTSGPRPAITRTNRPTIWRKISGVFATVAYTPTRSRGMSTPSDTMFTATIHGSRERRNPSSFLCAFASVCSTTVGDAPVISRSAPATARACDESAVTTSPPASRWPAARTSSNFACAARRIRGRPSGSSVEIAVRYRRPASRVDSTSSNDVSMTSSPDCHCSVPSYGTNATRRHTPSRTASAYVYETSGTATPPS